MENKVKFNSGSKNVLSSKDIRYMFKIINSNLEERDKALKLYSFCNYLSVCNTYSVYKNLELSEYILVKELIDLYEYYNVKGYFTPNNCIYSCSLKEMEYRVEKINIAYNIINSSLSDYNKADRLVNLFINSTELHKQYILLIKYGQNDIRLNGARLALNNFESILNKYKEFEDKGIISNIKYINDNKTYFETYEYAKFIIESYIMYKDSYNEIKFLNEYGINSDIFNYCIKSIEELDKDLYNKFIKKQSKNKYLNYMNKSMVIKDLASGIKTKILNDGTIFNLLEFIKRIPFKYTNSFLFDLDNYMKKNNIMEYDIIMKYIRDNELDISSALDNLDYNMIYKNSVVINGIEINYDVNNLLIEYMIQNNMPLVNKVYYIIRDEYIKGNINLDDIISLRRIKNSEKSLILIPSSKRN